MNGVECIAAVADMLTLAEREAGRPPVALTSLQFTIIALISRPYRDTDRSTASHASPCRNHVGEQSPSLETSFRHISNEQKVCNFEQTAVG